VVVDRHAPQLIVELGAMLEVVPDGIAGAGTPRARSRVTWIAWIAGSAWIAGTTWIAGDQPRWLREDPRIITAPTGHRRYTTQQNCHTRYTLHYELPLDEVARQRCSRAGWTLGDPEGNSKSRTASHGSCCRVDLSASVSSALQMLQREV
jgi:hypothetical protein